MMPAHLKKYRRQVDTNDKFRRDFCNLSVSYSIKFAKMKVTKMKVINQMQ